MESKAVQTVYVDGGRVETQVDKDLNWSQWIDPPVNNRKVIKGLRLNDFYKGDKFYFPGYKLKFEIESSNVFEKSKIIVMLRKRMIKIGNNIKHAFGQVNAVKLIIDAQGKKRFSFPCLVKECLYEGYGNSLKNHLLSSHKYTVTDAKLQISLYCRYFKYSCRLIKTGFTMPTICYKCSIVVDRIDKHFASVHQSEESSSKKIVKERIIQLQRNTKKIFESSCLLIKDMNFNKVSLSTSIDTSNSGAVRRNLALDVTTQRQHFLTFKKKLTEEDKLTFKISTSSRFKWYYDNSMNSITDFSDYLENVKQQSYKQAKQNAENVKEIWGAIDNDLNMNKNLLSDPELIEEDFLIHHMHKLAKQTNQLHTSSKRQKTCYQASTLKVKLASLVLFCKFLKKKHIYAGLTWNDLDDVIMKVDELSESLKPMIFQRKNDIKEYDSMNLLSVDDLRVYITSDHIKHIRSLLNDNLEEQKLLRSQIRDIRNHLMFILSWTNALRASNIRNCTIKHFYDAKDHPGLPTYKIMLSERHKTSAVYGRKVILLTKETYSHLKSYIEKHRNSLIDDKSKDSSERYIFALTTSSNNVTQITHSAISNCLSSSFKKAQVFREKNVDQRVSPSRIRKSVSTLLVQNRNYSVDQIANSFMMHSPAVSKRYYVHQNNILEASAIAKSCYSMIDQRDDLYVSINNDAVCEKAIPPKQSSKNEIEASTTYTEVMHLSESIDTIEDENDVLSALKSHPTATPNKPSITHEIEASTTYTEAMHLSEIIDTIEDENDVQSALTSYPTATPNKPSIINENEDSTTYTENVHLRESNDTIQDEDDIISAWTTSPTATPNKPSITNESEDSTTYSENVHLSESNDTIQDENDVQSAWKTSPTATPNKPSITNESEDSTTYSENVHLSESSDTIQDKNDVQFAWKTSPTATPNKPSITNENEDSTTYTENGYLSESNDTIQDENDVLSALKTSEFEESQHCGTTVELEGEEFQNSAFKKREWYQAKKFSREVVMKVLFAIHPYINKTTEPSKKEWDHSCVQLLASGIKLDLNLKWQIIRQITKAMWKKFHKQKNRKAYERFLNSSVEFVRKHCITLSL